MRASVAKYFEYFSAGFEARVPVLYLDIKGLVTTGVGNLVDPMPLALELPWMHRNTTLDVPASQAEIINEWNRVKAATAHATGPTSYWLATARLQLNTQAIDDLVARKAAEFERGLSAYAEFKDFPEWPADAQLGILSMAWAMGDGGFATFPHFRAAAAKGDFRGMAAQCYLDTTDNPGLVSRNRANFELFTNASIIVRSKAFDYDKIVWPTQLPV